MSEVTLESKNSVKVYKIETNEGKIIEFKNSKLGYAEISEGKIINTKNNGEEEVYQLSDVKKIYTEEFSVSKTVGLVIVSAVTVYLILLTAFIISMDGRGFGG